MQFLIWQEWSFLQVYEKLISGLYLGELTRILIVDAIEKGVLKSFPLTVFQTPKVFDTKHISAIEDDIRASQGQESDEAPFHHMDQALLDVGLTRTQLDQITDFDKQALRWV